MSQDEDQREQVERGVIAKNTKEAAQRGRRLGLGGTLAVSLVQGARGLYKTFKVIGRRTNRTWDPPDED